MTIWERIGELMSRAPGNALAAMIDAIRTVFKGDPELRRRVAFSVAMIALSAKMAKADGIVTPNEISAFREIFSIPQSHERNVARLYNLAKQDVAGFEAYAEQMARLCGSGRPDCAMLEDILDGLFHIAKADGFVHEAEVAFLARVAEIFEISEAHFDSILSRHVKRGDSDPYAILGVERDWPFDAIRKRYRQLVLENHPDRLIARGVPEEFLAIANDRVAAINSAYEHIERSRQPA